MSFETIPECYHPREDADMMNVLKIMNTIKMKKKCIWAFRVKNRWYNRNYSFKNKRRNLK